MRQASPHPAIRPSHPRIVALLALGLLALPGMAAAATPWESCESMTDLGTVSSGSIVSGSGDIQYHNHCQEFPVTVDANADGYEFRMKGYDSGDGENKDPYLRLVDSDGTTVLQEDDDSGTGFNALVTVPAPASGTRDLYLQATGTDGNRTAETGTYEIEGTSYGDDCAGDTTTGCSLLDLTSSTDTQQDTGGIEVAADSDWFAVTLGNDSADSYRFDLESNDIDAYLELRDSSGSLLKEDEDGGNGSDAHLTYASPGSGTTFYIAARSSKDASGTDTTGSYTVSYTGYKDNCSDDTGTGCTITATTKTGTLDVFGDSDWYEADTAAWTSGQSLRFELTGDSSGSPIASPRLRLYDSSGTELDSASGDPARLTYTPSSSTETLYIAAESGGDADDGDYKLTMTVFTDHCAGDTSTTCGTLGVPDTFESNEANLESAGDTDWVETVSLNKGTAYRFDLQGKDNGSGALPDPLLRIHDGSGNELHSNDDGGAGSDAVLAFTAPASSTYYASAESGTSGDIGGYALSLSSRGTDDYAADTGTTGTLSVGGSADGDLEVTGDYDWFALSLEKDKDYTFTLDTSSFVNPSLRLLDSEGKEVASGDGSLTITLGSAGTYYLEAGQANDEQIGAYTVSADLTSSLSSSSGSEGSGASGGGCTLTARPGPADPTLPALLGLGLAYLLLRRRPA